MRYAIYALAGAALSFAAVTGFFAASAFSQTDPPTRTITIDVTGPQGEQGVPGPAGPAGPAGPPGPGTECPTGWEQTVIEIIQQGKGPTRFIACAES